MLTAAAFFDADAPAEREIRETADALFRRADWQWALYAVPCNANGWPTETVEDVTIIHGGPPENGFISHRYQGYDESLLMHVLGFGSSTFPLPPECYRAWQKTFEWRKQYGIEYLHMGPLFIHQLSHCWLDFRGITDGFMQAKGLDYFENSRRAVRVQRSYAEENPKKFRGYGPLCWGVSASDGPGPATKKIENADRDFWMYRARGVPEGPDDGTLAPGAVAASLPFAPEPVADTLRELVRAYPSLRSEYGLRASLNPTFGDWVSPLNYGLDQGPIVMMIENHRTGLLWNLMRRCPYIWRGLRQAVVEPRARLAFGDHPVQWVHAGCFHADKNLSAPRLGSGSLRDFDTGWIAVRVDSCGEHTCPRMLLRSFAVRRALRQLAEWRAPLAPPPLDGVWALWLAFGFEPSAGESRLPKPAPDVRAAPHEVPQETGPLVLDHHHDRTLIQSIIQWAYPVAEGRIQAGAQAVFTAQGGVRANKLS